MANENDDCLLVPALQIPDQMVGNYDHDEYDMESRINESVYLMQLEEIQKCIIVCDGSYQLRVSKELGNSAWVA
jgi:hypothetical protein